MRRANALITTLVMALFLLHLVWGALILCGMTKGGSQILTVASWLLLILICVHMLLSVKLTFDTITASRKAGVHYLKENRIFWLRRISGFALLLFIGVHVIIFRADVSGGSARLHLFDEAALASQILMIVSLLVHLLTNIGPLRIAFGLSDKANVRTDILIVTAIGLFLAGAAFVIYFIRWLVI